MIEHVPPAPTPPHAHTPSTQGGREESEKRHGSVYYGWGLLGFINSRKTRSGEEF